MLGLLCRRCDPPLAARTPRTRSTTPRPGLTYLETTPKTPPPRRHATANEPARGRRRRQPHPSAPGATPVKKQHNLRTSAPRPRANRQTQKRLNA